MCITQALLYGKKHIPARISIVLGIVFVMLTILKLWKWGEGKLCALYYLKVDQLVKIWYIFN